MTKINVDIISDVSCPWCIIGYKSFSAAVEQLKADENIQLNWLPFELNPDMPAEGQNRNEYIQQKYGLSQQQSNANRDNLISRGLAVGYKFDFPDQGRVYNTFNAHRLLYWAKQFGQQTELKLALFDLFFQQRGNPSNANDLLACVEKVGLDSELARRVLDSDEFTQEVNIEKDFAFNNGISSVPAFIFNKKYLVSGGQPQSVFASALSELLDEVGALSG